MISFYVNGHLWRLIFVGPSNVELIDRSGIQRIATTDPVTHQIYLSSDLRGDLLHRVVTHEIGHVILISYNLLDEIHRMTYPKNWIEIEEWICNFLVDHGLENSELVKSILSGIEN